MTTLDQLEALADAALVIDHNENADWYSEEELHRFFHYPKNYRFIAASNPQTIKQLITLCRMQNAALKKYQQRQSMDDLEYAGYAGDEALAAFDKFNGGE